MGIDHHDLEKLESLILNDSIQKSGDVVFRQGDEFQKVYAVKSGMYKSSRVDFEGNEHISGFHLPGELIGLEAIYSKTYPHTTNALTTSSLCEFEYDQLTELAASIPALQQQLLRLLSKEISFSQAFHPEQRAEQKLAGFIYNLAKRYEVRGYSGKALVLAMTKQDIANHLGMAAETISRLQKRLQEKGILGIKNREITILDEQNLLQLAGCEASLEDTSKIIKQLKG
jgi:CRP/FNR family transcriptional regulator